ncbi:N-acetylglucosamine-6-phosphate deacetylase [Pedobacter immunditicola]|uniref:N-acetylglucosamine-6-phosphate deacetylase n=1 Tax=Pedobacter immunditicola TaxID=3133440 RepID=UPI003098CA6E
MIAIKNCKYFQDHQLISNHHVLIAEGKIKALTTDEIPAGYHVIDAKGQYLTSGFLELQIYGSGGNLFSAFPTVETLRQMDADLISKGTTGFMACLATNTLEVFYKAIDAAKAYRNEAKAFMGLHLEGPYLNPKRRGAHIESLICKASLDEVKKLIEYADGTVKIMTMAAELQDDDVIQYLLDQGVVLSLGHSDATFEQAMDAYNKGFSTTTHLFNAMPSIHHRSPNLPVAVLNHPTAMASIIADGQHVNFEVVRMSYQLMKERLFLITDAVTECQVGPYQHQLSGDKFITEEGTLSGSNITLLDAVRNCVEHCGIPLSSALNMASLHPAKAIDKSTIYGSVSVGKSADLLLLNDDLILQQAFVAGVEHLITNN